MKLKTKLSTTEKNSVFAYLFIGIMTAILALSLTGCSTRKVDKSKTVETAQIKSIDSSKTETTKESNFKLVDSSSTDEVELIPFDNTKPMVVNGKSYSNAIIKRKATKLNKVVDVNEKVSQIEQKAVKNESEATKVVDVKQTERHSFSWWWLLLLLLIPIYIYRKEIFFILKGFV